MKHTKEEIEAVKKEYLEEHTYHGTDKPVVLDDRTVEYVLFGRERLALFLADVHESHEVSEWRTEVMAPCGTARYYQFRECKNCGEAQYHSNSGRFNTLNRECKEQEE